MKQNNRPSKEQVRNWLMERWKHKAPLPAIEQIRHQLNWDLGSSHKLTPAIVRQVMIDNDTANIHD
jgi:hypothetical protein